MANPICLYAERDFRRVLEIALAMRVFPPVMTRLSMESSYHHGHVEFTVGFSGGRSCRFGVDLRDLQDSPFDPEGLFGELEDFYLSLAAAAGQQTTYSIRPCTNDQTIELLEDAENLTAVQARALMVNTRDMIDREFMAGFFGTGRQSDLISGASARAVELLKQWLSPDQLTQYERDESIDVRGSSSGKRYRIHNGRSSNVAELDDAGVIVRRLCFLPEGNLPIADVMLAQKIALETDEAGALKVAVHHRGFAPGGIIVGHWPEGPGPLLHTTVLDDPYG